MTPQQEERLVALKQEHGALTPDIVVDDALRGGVLRDLFDFDVHRSARRDWIRQAQVIIRSVRLDVQTTEATVSTVRDVHDPYAGQEQGYADVLAVRNSSDWSEKVLDEELKRLHSQLDRTRKLAATFGMEHRVNEFLQEALHPAGLVA